MFPTTAPFNGPSSSFNLSQDRLALTRTLTDVDGQINGLPQVADPNVSAIATPTLSAMMAVGLPHGSLVLSGSQTTVGRLSLPLTANSDTFFDVAPTGLGNRSDFPARSLIFQTSGSFQGFYAGVPSALMAAATVDVSRGTRFWQNYTAEFISPGGGWGPALCDVFGNGYVVRMTSTAGGGLFRAVSFEASGPALAIISSSTTNQSGLHSFALGVRSTAAGIELIVKLDSTSDVALLGIDESPTIDLTAVYPGFVSDGGSVYLASWSWYNEDGTAPAGWVSTVVPIGAPPPPVIPGAVRFFVVASGTSPISISAIFTRHEVATKLAAARAELELLSKSYF